MDPNVTGQKVSLRKLRVYLGDKDPIAEVSGDVALRPGQLDLIHPRIEPC